jgi:hypothetical protein
MLLWSLSFFSLFIGIRILGIKLIESFPKLGLSQQKKALEKIEQRLIEIEETLLAGLIPTSEQWDGLKTLTPPWGSLVSDSLQKLRTSGSSLLPTLIRLRSLAKDQSRALSEARSKSSQAFAQATTCGILVPLLGWGLYNILPSLEKQTTLWILACFLALILTGLGSLWLLKLAESARWGGLALSRRVWILSSQCAGERFLALVRSGMPPDLAWIETTKPLIKEAPDLATAWGHSVWQLTKTSESGSMDQAIIQTGSAIKKAVQISLMEGRPCTERVESALLALQHEIQAHIERELSLLSTRALKPLFLCVAPSVMSLLFLGLWLTAQETLGDSLQNVF